MFEVDGNLYHNLEVEDWDLTRCCLTTASLVWTQDCVVLVKDASCMHCSIHLFWPRLTGRCSPKFISQTIYITCSIYQPVGFFKVCFVKWMVQIDLKGWFLGVISVTFSIPNFEIIGVCHCIFQTCLKEEHLLNSWNKLWKPWNELFIYLLIYCFIYLLKFKFTFNPVWFPFVSRKLSTYDDEYYVVCFILVIFALLM